MIRNWKTFLQGADGRPPIAEPKSSKPSKTIPNMSPPLEDLLARYSRGQEIYQFEPVFSDELPGVEAMDEIERIEAARELRLKIDQYRARIASMRKPADDDDSDDDTGDDDDGNKADGED